MLADFGLAMTAEGKRRTLPGYVVGTPAYMSPEQGAPGGQVDARADIYALGCVVYEMLAGEPPFPAATTRAVLIRHAVDPVPSLRTLRPGISPELEQALFSALAKSPSERPAEAGRFAAALARARVAPWSPPRRLRGLRRMLPLVGLLLVASLPLALELPPHSDARAAGAVGRRLSVEVFANRTGDPTLDPFGELVREWLSGALAASRVVEVDLSSPSTRTPVARGRPTGNRTAGVLPTDLRVAGSYFRAGSGIALHATITNLRSGRVTFAAEPVHLDLENPGPGLARLREELIRRLTTPP